LEVLPTGMIHNLSRTEATMLSPGERKGRDLVKVKGGLISQTALVHGTVRFNFTFKN